MHPVCASSEPCKLGNAVTFSKTARNDAGERHRRPDERGWTILRVYDALLNSRIDETRRRRERRAGWPLSSGNNDENGTPLQMTKREGYCEGRPKGRRVSWCAPFSNRRDVDADPRVFIQLSNLFNVCIHCALPPRTLSRTQLGFNSAPFHRQTRSCTVSVRGCVCHDEWKLD